MNGNLRWKQRLQNLNKAFSRLRHACALPEYNELEMAGLVQTYESTFKLWGPCLWQGVVLPFHGMKGF